MDLTKYINLAEGTISTNMKLIIPRQPIVPFYQAPSVPLLRPQNSYYRPKQDKKKQDEDNSQTKYEILE
jgi:hypothetical protein